MVEYVSKNEGSVFRVEAIVLAGGFGTRLMHVVSDVPKPMAPVCGKPFLQYILDDLANKGVDRVVLAVGYKRESIEEHFGLTYAGMELVYYSEDKPLFTGGAIRQAMGHILGKRAFVVNGDTYFDVALDEMEHVHVCSGAVLTIAVKPMRGFDRYGTVCTDENRRVTAFLEKRFCEAGEINGGIYLLEKAEMTALEQERFSFETEYMEVHVADRPIYAFRSEGYFIDIGVPEDYARAQKDFAGHE